jgi:hypothetical protein
VCKVEILDHSPLSGMSLEKKYKKAVDSGLDWL